MGGNTPSSSVHVIFQARILLVVVQSLSRVWLSVTPWNATHQISLSFTLSPRVCSNSCPLSRWCNPTIPFPVTSFSSCMNSIKRQKEHWSGLRFPTPEDLPDLGTEAKSPALAGGFFTTEPPRRSKYHGLRLQRRGRQLTWRLKSKCC